ncbi:TP901 family phage tail tape measure protein [Rubricella aquisinus]|uniref:TP901 family phage tail tape measure protein n=1 Tax=Rubricella aquisinus TaxID=2028108 RepID=A0A840X1L3_9RHOB|nr:phage tail tape measure protein [Rubricella aquisinus]MBB5515756.1 TP901 family phage tail tape measure protein [Rubricella aquisinus]
MATKRIETQLIIKAVDQYSRTLNSMRAVTGRFAETVRGQMGQLQSLRGPLRLIEDFNRQRQVVTRSGHALEASRERVRQLMATIRATRNPTAQMRAELERARAASDRLEQQHRRNRSALHGMQVGLRDAGVNTGDLAGEQRRLAAALNTATASFDRQMERMRRVEQMQDRIAQGRARMDQTLARAANLNFVGQASIQTGRRLLGAMAAPVRQAVEFESAMSDVRKVVDFDTPEGFAQMSEDILAMSTRIPIAASGLAQIVAAGGQSGIAREELAHFAEMAAKIGVAFDISADHAGNSMARIKTAMGLTLEETGALFDAMNHLSNNSAARAEQTLDFINRAGASGAQFGFSETETLAMGAAMIAAGAGADTAATSFRNMGRALTRGESATDRQRDALERLGLDAAEVARSMQVDAVETTTDVLARLRALPDHLRASTMTDLFGDEARELTKLINNAELLPKLLSMVADERDYLGSAEAEYATRSETTANNIQLMRNQMERLGVSIGAVVLPPLNDLLERSQGIIDRMVTWTKEHPKLTKGLLVGAAAVGALAVAGGVLLTAAAGLIGTMAVLRFGMVGLGARAVFAAGDLAMVATRFRALGALRRFRLARLITPLAWTATLLPPIRWRAMAGGLRWTSLIRPLAWIGMGALRFIPVIGWAALAGELAWHLLIKPLGWDKYLSLDALGGYIDQIKQWFTFDLGELISWPEPPRWLSNLISGEGGAMPSSAGRLERRAGGGTVRAGQPYLVNENTPRSEWFVPSQSGGILNVSQAQAAFRSHLSHGMRKGTDAARLRNGARGVRAASVAVLAGSLAATPAAAQAASGPASVSIQIENFSVQVPSGVSDPDAIAELVADRIGARVAATLSASFSK